MTHRERVLTALEHKETDRIPIAMLCSGINQPAYDEFNNYCIANFGKSACEYIDETVDIDHVSPTYIGPKFESGFDIWGVGRRSMSYGKGAYEEIFHYPLADVKDISELDKHNWPSAEYYDYESTGDIIKASKNKSEKCIITSGGNIFETAWYMRGFERMFEDIITNPSLAMAIMERVTDFYLSFAKNILQSADSMIDLYFTADDIGGQQGLLMSLPMWEECIKPFHIELNKTIHEFGAKVVYHSDGSVMEAIPGLIDMGIDVLQALQFDAKGMDPVLMKDLYGDKLCFEGGISVQSTLPFKSAKDAIQEVKDRIDILGKNGGYILGPSHAIQAGTPAENIAAMFETARDYNIKKVKI